MSPTTLLHPALLPPRMRPAENSQPLPSPDTNSQIFTYDLPKREPDFNQEPWDPDYSYSIPETTGVQVQLPADAPSVPPQTGKTVSAFFLLYETTQCLLDCNTSETQTGHSRLFCFALNPSPSPTSETFIHEVNTRIRDSVALIQPVSLIISDVTVRPITFPIAH